MKINTQKKVISVQELLGRMNVDGHGWEVIQEYIELHGTELNLEYFRELLEEWNVNHQRTMEILQGLSGKDGWTIKHESDEENKVEEVEENGGIPVSFGEDVPEDVVDCHGKPVEAPNKPVEGLAAVLPGNSAPWGQTPAKTASFKKMDKESVWTLDPVKAKKLAVEVAKDYPVKGEGDGRAWQTVFKGMELAVGLMNCVPSSSPFRTVVRCERDDLENILKFAVLATRMNPFGKLNDKFKAQWKIEEYGSFAVEFLRGPLVDKFVDCLGAKRVW